MNKTKFLTLAVIALVALNVAFLAFFLKHKKMGRPDGPRKIIIERLRFDQKQVADYEKLIQKHRADIVQKDGELAAARQVIYRQLLTDNFSKKDSLAAEIGRLQTSVEQIHLAHFKDIKSLCRADQKADFDALVVDLANYFPGPRGTQKVHNQ